MTILKSYTKKLRTEEDVDIVIALTHNNTIDKNVEYANLSGEYQIDAIINGHTHTEYSGEVIGIDKVFPYVQSAANGEYIGMITLNLDKDNKLIDGVAENLSVKPYLTECNEELELIIDHYQAEVEQVSSEVLTVAGKTISRSEATIWAANVLRLYENTDIGIMNNGGIRSSAFPIYQNESITVGRVWEIMPFDNIVKTCEMKAIDIIDVHKKTTITLSNNARIENNRLYIDNQEINQERLLTVATVDYLFDNPNYRFMYGNNIRNTEVLFRDYLIQNLREQEGNWYGN